MKAGIEAMSEATINEPRQSAASAAIEAAQPGHSIVLWRSLEDVEAVWRTLERSSDATVFQSFDMFAAWTRHIAKAYKAEWFVACVLDRVTKRPLMLIPLVCVRRGRLTYIEAGDLDVCDFNGPVLERRFTPSHDQMTAIWRDLKALLPPADVIRVTKMPHSLGTHPNPLLLLGQSHRISLSNFKTPLTSRGVRWSLDALPEKLRQDMAVRRRKLERRGKLSFITAQSDAQADAFFDAMIAQREQRFAATGRQNILDCPSHRAFYRALLTPEAPTSAGCIQALVLDGEIIATGYGLVSDDGFHMIFPTFKSDRWRNYSPGMLLFLDSMAWSCERGFAYYDFTIGGESFKMTLGAQEFPLYEHLEALTLRGRPAVYGERIKRMMGSCGPLRRLVVSARSLKARVPGSRAGS